MSGELRAVRENQETAVSEIANALQLLSPAFYDQATPTHREEIRARVQVRLRNALELFTKGRVIQLESNDPGSKAEDRCETSMSQELYEIAKHLEQVIYRDAKERKRTWEQSIRALSSNLIVWIYG